MDQRDKRRKAGFGHKGLRTENNTELDGKKGKEEDNEVGNGSRTIRKCREGSASRMTCCPYRGCINAWKDHA